MSFLARTRADSSRLSGEAFLALARGDSAGAARKFEGVAVELQDVSPLALSVAARLFLAAKDTTKSVAIWQSLVAKYEEAPEAAEAELAWSRVLRRRSEDALAVEHLEHLILTWPQSALVPQARRELDIARGRLVPVKGA